MRRDVDVRVAADEDGGRAVTAGFAPAPERGDIAFHAALIGDANDAPGLALGSGEENHAGDLRPVLLSAETLEFVGVAVSAAEVDRPVCRVMFLLRSCSLLCSLFVLFARPGQEVFRKQRGNDCGERTGRAS